LCKQYSIAEEGMLIRACRASPAHMRVPWVRVPCQPSSYMCVPCQPSAACAVSDVRGLSRTVERAPSRCVAVVCPGCDYFSIPQRSKVLQSLGVYAASCRFFVVIAPPCEHKDRTDPSGAPMRCDLSTYMQRGCVCAAPTVCASSPLACCAHCAALPPGDRWCRLERAATCCLLLATCYLLLAT
jgi:hypothetical protein